MNAATTTRPPRRVQKEGRCHVDSTAGIDAVWEVVRDVTRTGEWSHECTSVAWLGDATSASPGARFRGRNRSGIFRWGRKCEIVAAAPHTLTWRTIPTVMYPDSTEWSISLQPLPAGGTRIEQSFHVVRAPKILDPIYAVLVPNHRDRSEALRADMQRLADLAVDLPMTSANLRDDAKS